MSSFWPNLTKSQWDRSWEQVGKRGTLPYSRITCIPGRPDYVWTFEDFEAGYPLGLEPYYGA
jgi:hypothetical protein